MLVVLLDAFLPGVGPWKDVWLLRDLWRFEYFKAFEQDARDFAAFSAKGLEMRTPAPG